MDVLILVPIILPVAGGLVLLVSSFAEHLREKASMGNSFTGDSGSGNRLLHVYTAAILVISVAFALGLAWTGDRSITLFTLLQDISIGFRIDAIGRWFVTLLSIIWLAAGVFAFAYMGHEGEKKRYFGLYLMLYGVLAALNFSGNLVTMYLFYEVMTLVSMPLVMHSGTRESVMAALKYLFYSLCGTYGGLFGIFFLYRYCISLSFTPGGTLDMAAVQGHEGILLLAVFVMLLGFGAKAGMLPLHGWLPTAHPVAPSPASAVMSSVIVKMGVLAIIRTVYYIAGPEFLRGTWVQYAWLILTLLTVFMGSMLACRQQILKKRLAYSTVSQVSYILFGLALMTPLGMVGALLHVAVHGVIKCGLFLTAGVFLRRYGITRVEELSGIGRRMPKVMWCYTFLSLGLIGIPPMGGFISKWYLAEGALQWGAGTLAWLGPVVLLVSALLTAGYLFPVVMKGFFPGESGWEGIRSIRKKTVSVGSIRNGGNDERQENFETSKISEAAQGTESVGKEVGNRDAENGSMGYREPISEEPGPAMLLPLVVLAAMTVFIGVLPNPLVGYVTEVAGQLLW